MTIIPRAARWGLRVNVAASTVDSCAIVVRVCVQNNADIVDVTDG